MIHKSYYLSIPTKVPFDKQNWFESVIGNFVVPLVDTGLLSRFWFSRYGGLPVKQIRFRFSTEKFEEFYPLLSEAISNFGLIDCMEAGPASTYDYVGDLGSDRFLGINRRTNDRCKRSNLVYDYLYHLCKLYIDCLSHADQEGRWQLETNLDRDNNEMGNTIETFHHLFDNITGLNPLVVETDDPALPRWMSPLYYKIHYGNKHSEAGLEGPPLIPQPKDVGRIVF